MKLLSLATVRTGNEIPDPIVCAMSSELSSFGFFQRPVSRVELVSSLRRIGGTSIEIEIGTTERSRNWSELKSNWCIASRRFCWKLNVGPWKKDSDRRQLFEYIIIRCSTNGRLFKKRYVTSTQRNWIRGRMWIPNSFFSFGCHVLLFWAWEKVSSSRLFVDWRF
jgi:hypothetical protein